MIAGRLTTGSLIMQLRSVGIKNYPALILNVRKTEDEVMIEVLEQCGKVSFHVTRPDALCRFQPLS